MVDFFVVCCFYVINFWLFFFIYFQFLVFGFVFYVFFCLYVQVGEDEFGYMFVDILKENNVNNEGMRFDFGVRIVLVFVILRNDGEREFMFYRNFSVDMLLQEFEFDIDFIKKVFINIRNYFNEWSVESRKLKIESV